MTSRFRSVAYWASTVIVALAFILGGAIDASRSPDAVAFLGHLGYPAYFGVIIGVWKILGGVAIVAPSLPRAKEWAYAGILFDLTGAAISHVAVGDGVRVAAIPLVLAAFAVTSWMLRPASRRLALATSNPTPGQDAPAMRVLQHGS